MTPGIVDAHNDLLLELAFRLHRCNEANPFGAHWLEHLTGGGVVLQVCPAYPDLDRMPEGSLRQVLGQVACFHAAVREHPDRVVAVLAAADLDRVESSERLGLMLSLEGAESLGYDMWMAELVWELGVRMLGLAWNRGTSLRTARRSLGQVAGAASVARWSAAGPSWG